MASLLRKKLHHAHAEIHLSPQSDHHSHPSADHFLSDETVNGYAQIKLPPATQFSHSKITLKGKQFLGVQFEGKARAASQSEDGVVRIPFHFSLSECERLSSLESGLPPSFDSRSEGQRASDVQYEVTYSIAVTAFSPRASLASASQKIYILPVSPAALSEGHSDVPNEYFWAEPTSKQPKLDHSGLPGSMTASGPRVELAGQAPDPIIFNPYDATPEGSTEIPFIAKLLYPNTATASQVVTPTRCEMKAHLVSKTHITPDGKHSAGTILDRVHDAGDRVTKSHVSDAQESTAHINHWEPCVSCITDPFFVARFSVPFSARDKTLIPTFSTAILSRKYSIDLTLSFPDFPQQSYKLSLDVEVVHGTPELEDSEDDGKKSDGSSNVAEARL